LTSSSTDLLVDSLLVVKFSSSRYYRFELALRARSNL
jgi:hypothetical protein